jgi:hypothetical protein
MWFLSDRRGVELWNNTVNTAVAEKRKSPKWLTNETKRSKHSHRGWRKLLPVTRCGKITLHTPFWGRRGIEFKLKKLARNAANKEIFRKYTGVQLEDTSQQWVLTRSETGPRKVLTFPSTHSVCNGVIFPSAVSVTSGLLIVKEKKKMRCARILEDRLTKGVFPDFKTKPPNESR